MQGYSAPDELIQLAEDVMAHASELRDLAERLAITATGARQRAARAKAVRRRTTPLKLVATN